MNKIILAADIGGTTNTTEMTDAIINELANIKVNA